MAIEMETIKKPADDVKCPPKKTDQKADDSKSPPKKDDQIADKSVGLKKELGLMNGIGVIIGVIIGSGIFVSPKGVLMHSGSILTCLVVWALSGMLSTFGACCYAELGVAIPKSGGEFAYLNASFGPLLAFLYLWVALLIINPTGNAIIALTFAEYILQPFYRACPTPQLAVKLLAVVVICRKDRNKPKSLNKVKYRIRQPDGLEDAVEIQLVIKIMEAQIYNESFNNVV